MGYTPHPTEIRYREEDGLLTITFSDDVTRDYPTAYLRGFCPCAHCQGHSGGPPTWNALRSDAARRVEDVTQVGGYAICIHWGDRHDTGIYSFEYLRSMRPPEGFDPAEMNAGEEVELAKS